MAIISCTCNGSIPLDCDAIGDAVGTPLEAPASELCRRQIARFEGLMESADSLLVCCTQEAPLFLDVAEDSPFRTDLSFVNIREKAGWSREGASAAPKMAALIAEATLAIDGPQALTLESEGVVLVLGRDDVAMGAAARLADRLDVTLVLVGDERPFAPRIADFPVFHGGGITAQGSFADFTLKIADFAAADPSSRGTLRFLPPSPEVGTSRADIILDLSGGTPLFSAHEKRSGYFRPDPRDPAAIARALFDITDLVGTFEKPRYVDFRASICAHARSGIVGCSRCLDVCPTGAIVPAGDTVAIDPGICEGCGNCASVCPTGAAHYTMPDDAAIARRLSALLGAYARAGGTRPVLLLHNSDDGEAMIDAIADFGAGLPANVIPFALNAVTRWGLDTALAARVFGACRTLVLVPPGGANETDTLGEADRMARSILSGLGYDDGGIILLDERDPDALGDRIRALAAEVGEPAARPQGFTPAGSKRALMRLSLAALHKAAPAPVDAIVLPDGSPFGTIAVDGEACTLCLACVGACPAAALKDNPDFPRLSFLEEACVQCGLCARTCPEDAITLSPRITFTGEARSPRTMKEDQPFECIRCGKPFGTTSTIDAIVARMAGHAMFADADALNRLKMCSDCRVIDMAEAVSDPFAAGPRPKTRTTDDYLRQRAENRSAGHGENDDT